MDDIGSLAVRFEAHRSQMHSIAFRMLGSASEADDAVQEAWVRLQRSDSVAIDNLAAWLTTVVGRVCLDALRSRATRREDALEAIGDHAEAPGAGPEGDAVLADQVGVALMIVLDTLSPDERLAFVLHDLFGLPHRQIATILDKAPAATKMLASRARRRVRGVDRVSLHDHVKRREVVEAFLLASREGDFDRLVALLHPEATFSTDPTAASWGAPALVSGANAVARQLVGKAQAARLALIDGRPGAAWAQSGRLRSVFVFTVANEVITSISVVADPEQLAHLNVEFIGA